MTQNYEVLARRTRPQSFKELFGQDHVVAALGRMIESQKIPQAFLFTGTRGTGKTSSARILAKSLCCEKGPTAEPCQVCPQCVQITQSAHEDISEIDGASHTGVDNVRELHELAHSSPAFGRYKIFIIDEVHMLSTGAFNALLKTLEEPPPHVIFILATTELHKVPITVRSRCMIFSFRKLSAEQLTQHLTGILDKENTPYDEEAVKLIAREGKGSIRDSLSLLEQISAFCPTDKIDLENTKEALSSTGGEIAFQLLECILSANLEEGLQALRTADASGLDLSTLLQECAKVLKSCVVLKVGNFSEASQKLSQLLSDELAHLTPLIQAVTHSYLQECFSQITQGAQDTAKTTEPLVWAEATFLDCISRKSWLSPQELVETIKSGNASIAQGQSAQKKSL